MSLSANTLVYTDKGLVKISHVHLSHRLWDGENWVEHGGRTYAGLRPTTEILGVQGTRGHNILCQKRGWYRFADVKRLSPAPFDLSVAAPYLPLRPLSYTFLSITAFCYNIKAAGPFDCFTIQTLNGAAVVYGEDI